MMLRTAFSKSPSGTLYFISTLLFGKGNCSKYWINIKSEITYYLHKFIKTTNIWWVVNSSSFVFLTKSISCQGHIFQQHRDMSCYIQNFPIYILHSKPSFSIYKGFHVSPYSLPSRFWPIQNFAWLRKKCKILKFSFPHHQTGICIFTYLGFIVRTCWRRWLSDTIRNV